MIGYWWRHKKNTNSMRMVEWIENQNQNFLWMAEIVRSDKYNLLLSLSSLVIILNAFFVSCSKMPHAPTYDGHFDRLTVTRTNWNKISQTQLFFQERKLSHITNKVSKLSELWISKPFAIGLLQQMVTWYKIRHTGGQAHYYSCTGALKQRDLNQSTLSGLCLNVPVRE